MPQNAGIEPKKGAGMSGRRVSALSGTIALLLASTSALRADDEIQVYNGEIGDVIEVGLTKIRFEDETAVASGAASACYLEWTSGEHAGERILLTGARTT